MESKKIIAVVGMAGSGKTETTGYLMEKLKCPKVYFGKHTFERLKKEGLEINYENERLIREKIRSELGMGAYAKLSLPEIEKLIAENNFLVLESLAGWEEYKIIKEKFKTSFHVIAIYATPKLRFKRLVNRKKERPIKDWEEFEKRDYTEIEGQHKGGPIAMADFTIINESSFDNLKSKLDEIIELIKNSADDVG